MKTAKRVLTTLLVLIVVLSCMSSGFAAFSKESDEKKITDYSLGDIIEFGWYPQSRVTDTDLCNVLTENAGATDSWVSYNYKTYDYGTESYYSDYMKYKDVSYEGQKYRGVFFTRYRAERQMISFYQGLSYYMRMGYDATDTRVSTQHFWGYDIGNVYWFKYEPLKWRVLNPESGMIICESIIDSQPFHKDFFEDENGVFWGDSEKTFYANNYEMSSIRQWLNVDFFNLAFTLTQKSIIASTVLDNKAYDPKYSIYDSNDTEDKIYLLSYEDAQNSKYGFPSSGYGESLYADNTDYAKCQGVGIAEILSWDTELTEDVYCPVCWSLRTAGNYSGGILTVNQNNGFTGGIDSENGFGDCSSNGVRPVLNLKISGVICNHSSTELVNVTEPTCVLKGYSGDYVCSQCGDIILSGTVTDENGQHKSSDPVIENIHPATCKKIGAYDSVVYCSECNDELSRTVKTLPKDASNHIGTASAVKNAVAATADKEGYSGDIYWSCCDTLAQTGTVLPKLTGATVYAENISCASGQTVSIPVKISGNQGIMGYKLSFIYNETAMTPISVTPVSGFPGILVDSIETSKTNSFDVFWSNSSEISEDGVLFTIEFKISDNAAGNYSIGISYDSDNTFNENWEDVALICTDISLEVSGQSSEEPEEPIVNPPAGNGATVYSESIAGDTGEVSIPIYIKNNPGIMGYKINLAYDSDVIEPQRVVCSDAISGSFESNIGLYPNTFSVVWNSTENYSDDGLLFTVIVNLKSTEETVISVSYSEDDTFDDSWEEVKLSCDDIKINYKNIVSQELLIDYIGKTITGLSAGLSTIDDSINALHENSFSVQTNGGKVGTGSALSVYNKNGELIEKFDIVLFGDVNGDGWYDGMDAMIVKCIVAGMISKNDVSEAVYMAADCNHDGVVDDSDVELLEQAGVLLANVDQSKSKEELLETSSVYNEYLNLIDQGVESEEDNSTNEIVDLGFNNNLFEAIIEFVKYFIGLIKSVFINIV